METWQYILGVYTIVTALYVLLTAVLFLVAALAPAASAAQRVSSFWARSLASVALLAVAALYGVLAGLVLKPIGKAGLVQYLVARLYKWLMGLLMGVWFDIVEGEEHLLERPAVFIGNHQSELDILFLGAIFPKWCSVTAKASLKWTPILGQFMSLSNTVFIDRANRQSALKAFERAAKHMRGERQSVYIFPEGTRSYYDHAGLLPFKKGAFHLAVQAQVPLVPIVVANYSHVLNIKQRIFRPGRVPVKVLPPVSTEGLTADDVDRLCHDIREDMLKTIVGIGTAAAADGEQADGVAVSQVISTGVDVGAKSS